MPPTLVHSLAAGLGLSAVLAASATAFMAVKLAGAAYLLWLGIRMLRTRPAPDAGADPETSMIPRSARPGAARLLAHGFVTGLLNPKAALFFLAFLPQFVRPERGHVIAQFLILGAILALLDLVWAWMLSVAAARARHRLTETGWFARWSDRVAGAVLVAVGLKLAFARR